jgi:phosphoribosylamine--glycine ligase
MKVLVIGSGGREHALLWALKKSPTLTKLYVTPGRQAVENLGVLVDIDIQNSRDVTQFCKRENVEFVIIGPEQPIINGLQSLSPRNYVNNMVYQLPSMSVLLMKG